MSVAAPRISVGVADEPRPAPDAVLVAAVASLVAIGLVMIFSASSATAYAQYHDPTYYLKRQFVWLGVSLVAAFFAYRCDYHVLRRWAPALLGVSVFLLLAVLVPHVGLMRGGARRWLGAGALSFEPSEFAKLALVVYLAAALTRKGEKIRSLSSGVFPLLVVTAVCALLVLFEPDMGTASLLAFTSAAMLFAGGARVVHLIAAAIVTLPPVAYLALSSPYRRDRIFAFLDPWKDPLNTGFHIVQSLYALGSGGAVGLGLGLSRQKYFYLPEQYTDFIFAIIGEELGLLGHARRRGAVPGLRLSCRAHRTGRARPVRVPARRRLHGAHRRAGLRQHRRRHVVVAGDRRAASLHLVWGHFARDVHGRIRPSAQHRQAAIARILLTGGGTGGHVYPALAIAEALGDRPVRHDLLFVGSPDGLENAIVPKAGLPMAHVAARPLARKPSLDTLRTVAENAVGVAQALRVVAAFRPDCVVATGGYVTFPVVLAARALRPLRGGRPRIALLEPNAVAGLTNRLVAPLADEQWVAHPAARPATNVVVTGTPVRASILRAVPQAQARAALGLDAATTTIVVMGGSQGARRINDAVAALIAGGEERGWQILHLSGERDYDRARAAAASARMPVRVFAYLDDPAVAYAAADLVVARAGASTLAELAATATPALLVPYPYATDDHQARNAEAVAAAGAARVVADAEFDGERLASELTAALEPGVYGRLRACARALAAADARTLIVERIEALAARG